MRVTICRVRMAIVRVMMVGLACAVRNFVFSSFKHFLEQHPLEGAQLVGKFFLTF